MSAETAAPSQLRLAWRFALRELRGGLRGFRLLLACLALGVAALAAVGTVRAAIEAGLEAEGAALLGGDALLVGVLAVFHDRDGVGEIDEPRRRVTARRNDGDPFGAVAEGRLDLGRVDPSPVERIGDLVEDDESILACLDDFLPLTPGLPRFGLVFGEVGGIPGEAVAERLEVDAERFGHQLLAGDPVVAL